LLWRMRDKHKEASDHDDDGIEYISINDI